MRVGVGQALKRLEADRCDVVPMLRTDTFEGLQCERAWLVEPDHIIPAMVVAGLVEQRQLGRHCRGNALAMRHAQQIVCGGTRRLGSKCYIVLAAAQQCGDRDRQGAEDFGGRAILR